VDLQAILDYRDGRCSEVMQAACVYWHERDGHTAELGQEWQVWQLCGMVRPLGARTHWAASTTVTRVAKA
jgi:hypothetical protein